MVSVVLSLTIFYISKKKKFKAQKGKLSKMCLHRHILQTQVWLKILLYKLLLKQLDPGLYTENWWEKQCSYTNCL